MTAGITQDSTQNKLILLFVFDKMETAMTASTILDLCTYKNNWIDYANCVNTLSELERNNFIYKTYVNGGGDPLYDLTTEGRVCLAHFYVRIPSSVREVISATIKKSRIEYRRRQDYIANYQKREDGSYDVTLRIEEATKVTLEIHLNVMTRNTAKYIEKRWQDKAATVYTKLQDILVE
ncbi:MAG: DUF4364 family protein [Clostridia bacterium]|nr:DUF4364 family protein [Clostridia bacterium]